MIKAKHLLLMVGAMAMVLATAPLAKAVVILDFNDSYYLGNIDPGTPAGEQQETNYVNYLKGMAPGTTEDGVVNQDYTRSGNNFLYPNMPVALFPPVKNDDPTEDAEIAFGWDYVLGKYGQGISHVWYIAGLMENFTLPWESVEGRDLSHYSLFNARQVPDGGKTLLLLGLGLAGMIVLRRRMEA